MNRKICAFWATMLVVFSGSGVLAETTAFNTGELWQCTIQHDEAPPGEKIEFMVTGVATEREISRRLNFQNDKPVISVALIDRDPLACNSVRRFLHMAYSEEGLLACAPVLIEQGNQPSPSYLQSVRDARGNWLIRMQTGRGVVIGLNPSQFLGMLRRVRC